MTCFWWGFLAGLFIGANVALVMMALLIAARYDREEAERRRSHDANRIVV
jgi:hypothetical protein